MPAAQACGTLCLTPACLPTPPHPTPTMCLLQNHVPCMPCKPLTHTMYAALLPPPYLCLPPACMPWPACPSLGLPQPSAFQQPPPALCLPHITPPSSLPQPLPACGSPCPLCLVLVTPAFATPLLTPSHPLGWALLLPGQTGRQADTGKRHDRWVGWRWVEVDGWMVGGRRLCVVTVAAVACVVWW